MPILNSLIYSKILFGRTARTFVTSCNCFIIRFFCNDCFIIRWCDSHSTCFLMGYSIMMFSSCLNLFDFIRMTVDSRMFSNCNSIFTKVLTTCFTNIMRIIDWFIIGFLIYNCVRFLTCYSIMMYCFSFGRMMYCFSDRNVIVMLMFISF